MDAGKGNSGRTPRSGIVAKTLGAAALTASLALPAAALAHVERPSYWPDPAADTGVTPAAGGEVPVPRSLDTALTGPDDTNVVCKKNSLDLVKEAVKKARDNGYKILPTDDKKKLSKSKAGDHKRLNADLFDACEYRQHPRGGHGFGQQRPDRGDAGALHRAALARRAHRRSRLRRVRAARRLGHLRATRSTARTTRAWSSSRGARSGRPTRPTRRSRTVTASPTRATAFAATSRSRARG